MRKKLQALIITGMCLVTYGAAGQSSSQGQFRDDFTGKSLHPVWKIFGEKRDRWTLLDGEYLFVISGAWGTNVFVYNGPITDDYTIEIAVSAELRGTGSQQNRVLFAIEQDDKNGVYISVGGGLYETVLFSKLSGGIWSDVGQVLRSFPNDFSLRLRKKGVEIEGSYNAGGGWTSMGKQAFIGLEGRPLFTAFNREKVADAGVRIDYFEIIPQ
jgi:hypothetical protein